MRAWVLPMENRIDDAIVYQVYGYLKTKTEVDDLP